MYTKNCNIRIKSEKCQNSYIFYVWRPKLVFSLVVGMLKGIQEANIYQCWPPSRDRVRNPLSNFFGGTYTFVYYSQTKHDYWLIFTVLHLIDIVFSFSYIIYYSLPTYFYKNCWLHTQLSLLLSYFLWKLC